MSSSSPRRATSARWGPSSTRSRTGSVTWASSPSAARAPARAAGYSSTSATSSSTSSTPTSASSTSSSGCGRTVRRSTSRRSRLRDATPMTDATARRLVLVRHGETLDNAAGIWQGLKDSELSPVGLAQADKAAPVVAAYRPEVVVASDLERARVTAERIGDAAGMPVRLAPRLREIDVGQWQGVTAAEVRGRDPELLAAMGRGEDVRRGGTGETVAELASR